MKHFIKYIILFILILFLAHSINAKENIKPSIFDQLGFNEIVHVNLAVDWDALTANIRNEAKHQALFSYEDEAGENQQWNIQVKLRGKFRRMNCSKTPPMKFYFDKSDLKAAGLAKYNDMKLVNYCLEDAIEAKKLLVKEFMTYKLYNELAKESYRVQMLKITFRDTKSRRKIRQWAFLIEDTAQVRARVGAKKFKSKKTGNFYQFNHKSISKVALFQYMVGNSDWKLMAQKNVKFILKKGEIIAIPYDFDFTGLVNPSYGVPNPDFELKSMTERVYLDTIVPLSQVDIDFYIKRKAHLMNIIQDSHFVKRQVEKEMIKYLESFFQDLTIERIATDIPAKLTAENSNLMASNKLAQKQQ